MIKQIIPYFVQWTSPYDKKDKVHDHWIDIVINSEMSAYDIRRVVKEKIAEETGHLPSHIEITNINRL